MRQLAFPYALGSDGHSALAGPDDHIRDLIEQVLFTAPGERVNRPDFGSGLLQLVFAGQSDELAHATQALVSGALQRWLGELIDVAAVRVATGDSRLEVTVQYVVRRSRRAETAQFSREV
jgi:phage baseplate assembly protein W